jgi:hypothetical protein
MERNKINTAVVNKKQLMKKIHVSGQQLIILQLYYTTYTHKRERMGKQTYSLSSIIHARETSSLLNYPLTFPLVVTISTECLAIFQQKKIFMHPNY